MAESKLNWDKYSSDEEKKEKIEKPLQKPKKNKKPKHKEPVEETYHGLTYKGFIYWKCKK